MKKKSRRYRKNGTSERGAVQAISGERGVLKNPSPSKRSRESRFNGYDSNLRERLYSHPQGSKEYNAIIRKLWKLQRIQRDADPGVTKRGKKPRKNPSGNRSDVRSPTSTRTEVRSPTSTRTEVRSPTSTSTSTRADTRGNVTVTGGAGAGNTTVNLRHNPAHKGKRKNPEPQKVVYSLMHPKLNPVSGHPLKSKSALGAVREAMKISRAHGLRGAHLRAYHMAAGVSSRRKL